MEKLIRKSSPTRKIKDNEMKKNKSLEYHRTASAEREINNVWDIITTKPDYAKTLLLDQQKNNKAAKAIKRTNLTSKKSSESKRDSVVDNLENNQQALKQVLKRKEQLQTILSHLKETGNEKKGSIIKKTKKAKKSQKPVKTLPPFFPVALQVTKEIAPKKDEYTLDPVPLEIKSDSAASNVEPQKMLDFQKLFSDIPSVVHLDKIETKIQNIDLKELEDQESIHSNHLKINAVEKKEQNQIKETRSSSISPSKNDLEDNTHQKLEAFEASLLKFPYLMRRFYSSIPKTHEEGGLNLSEQGQVIHFGMKLETKILELIDQYINFTEQIGTLVLDGY